MSVLELGKLADLADPGSKGIEAEGEDDFFLVRRANHIFAYRNQCPHLGAPLEWMPDQFLDDSGDFIQCAMHGALFRIEDGYCVLGPCAGKNLTPVEIEVDGENLRRIQGAPAAESSAQETPFDTGESSHGKNSV